MAEGKHDFRFEMNMNQMILLFLYTRTLQGDEKINYREIKEFFKKWTSNIKNVNRVIDYMRDKNLVRIKKPSYHSKIVIPTEYGINRAIYFLEHPEKYNLQNFMDSISVYLLRRGDYETLWKLNEFKFDMIGYNNDNWEDNIEKEKIEKSKREIEKEKKLHEKERNREEDEKIIIDNQDSSGSIKTIEEIVKEYYERKGELIIWNNLRLNDFDFKLKDNLVVINGYIISISENNKRISLSNIQKKLNENNPRCVILVIKEEDNSQPSIVSEIMFDDSNNINKNQRYKDEISKLENQIKQIIKSKNRSYESIKRMTDRADGRMSKYNKYLK